MAARRIADDEPFVHFLTFSCDHRRRLLDHDHPKRIVLGVLGEQLTRQSATCLGFVVMPDHVHALAWFPTTRQLSRRVAVAESLSRAPGYTAGAPKSYSAEFIDAFPGRVVSCEADDGG